MVNKNLKGLLQEVQRVQSMLVDPINAEQQARYQSEGLTYLSNNTSIIPRDSAGNILLDESSTSNPLLIIDPVAELLTTKSALKILDTRFQYYKFPVTIKPAADVEDLIVDLDFESDTIAARYTIAATISEQGQPQTLQRIGTVSSDTWFTNGGEAQSGFTRLPFTGGQQSEIGSYTITPDVLDTLRAKNKTLKFSIQAQFNSSVTDTTEFTLSIGRTMPEAWRSSGTTYQLRSESNGEYGANEYPYFYIEYVIDIINDAAPYDKYIINVVASERAWVLTDNCFWKIDVIDIPTTPSLNGDIGTGVYDFSGNSILSAVTDAGYTITDIFQKDSSNQLIKLPEYVYDSTQVSASNPTGNVSEDIDETYPPFGEKGVADGERRTFQASNYANIDYRWSGADQKWIEEE